MINKEELSEIMQEAWIAYNNKEIEKAIYLTEKDINSSSSTNISPWTLLARISLDQENYKSAITIFSKILSINPHSGIFHDLSVCFFMTGDIVKAINSMLSAIEHQDNQEKSCLFRSELVAMLEEANDSNAINIISVYNEVARTLKRSDFNIYIYSLYIEILPYALSSKLIPDREVIETIEIALDKDLAGIGLVINSIRDLIFSDENLKSIINYKGNINNIYSFFNNRVNHFYINNFIISRPEFEMFLQLSRKIIIKKLLLNNLLGEEDILIISSIAKQSWNSEYILWYSDDDIKLLNNIKENDEDIYISIDDVFLS